MSKYTEAETKIKKIMCEEIDRLPSHLDGEDEVYDSTKDVDEILELNKTICEALEIADRLEQITENGTNRITEVLCKDCKEKELQGCRGICRAMLNVLDGYMLALSDIRGDTE